jgi:hypothetical protein
MKELEKFVSEVNSSGAYIKLNASHAASIEAAMGIADQQVDQVAGRYHRNPLIQEVALGLKQRFCEQILEQSASSRLENNDEENMKLSADVGST